MLLSAAFKDASKNQSEDQIDADHLKVFSLMHCSGKPVDKTNAFYCILQEGGFEKHEQISAGDKDFIPVFDKICAFATVDIFKLALDAGSVSANVYSETEEKSLVAKDTCEIIREEQWLEEVFGANSRLESGVWVQSVSKKANWIFDANEMRKRLFETAGITIRH